MSNNWYLNNPLIHKDRQAGSSSSRWVKQFSCEGMKPLIICRGPIRKEAMDVFDEMGIDGYGILLSEKDSITYSNALAPELRTLTDPTRVHRVPDYTGASKEERLQRIDQIIGIAKENDYDSIFAGYGFMAEDEEMVKSMESAGLRFIGPCSGTQRAAGLKDEAKRTALKVGVSVTPGIDNASALTLLKKYPNEKALRELVSSENLEVEDSVWQDKELALEGKADAVLAASYDAGIDLYSADELSAELQSQVAQMFTRHPANRIRLKAISGGGGKGQRILSAADSYEGDSKRQLEQAIARVPELVREILAEVKCNGVGDNKNVLAEMNIETTRHQEIQVIGNGDWCMTLGGRDCSLQMHEQKLLEVSITVEELAEAIECAKAAANEAEVAALERDLDTLEKMESEASRFGAAVGLDSVATFECIVDGNSHFFMEMNTRIQVEHRVTELCYALKFCNPDNVEDYFLVDSLVEAMVLLEYHGGKLPKPERVRRENSSVEARLNATNAALQPHAGGRIKRWSDAIEGEIRDDQGISLHNPDTDIFMEYHLAGAYDSNIALLLTVGENRQKSYHAMAETLRVTQLTGSNLCTNLEFHYGLVHWFLGQGINARPTTGFVVPYLTAVGEIKQLADNLDLVYSYQEIKKALISDLGDNATHATALGTVIDQKETLVQRPLRMLLENPHLFSGWLSAHRGHFAEQDAHLVWLENPVVVLNDTYTYLNMDYIEDSPSLYQIWDHDYKILQDALAFYATIEQKTGISDWSELQDLLAAETGPRGLKGEWAAIQSAHQGYQAGLEVLLLLPFVAQQSDFYALSVRSDLSISIPDRLRDPELQEQMAKVLAPPPIAKSDEVVAESGGMFYPREAPGMDTFVKQGDHFEEGDALYIVEVMKMFNKVHAPFAGKIDKILVDADGVIIKKGQPLFKVSPDEEIIVESPETIAERRKQATKSFLARVL